MTSDEVIADMRERLTNGMNHLGELRRQSDDRDRRIMLMGKIEGLALAKDWLRSYPPHHRPPERMLDGADQQGSDE